MLHISPAVIMFMFTIAFASAFLIPMTSYSPKNALVRFYWRGIWIFLSTICSFAGAGQTLNMLGFSAQATAEAFLQILLLTFVIFVIFGWFRLAGKAALFTIRRVLGFDKAAKTA